MLTVYQPLLSHCEWGRPRSRPGQHPVGKTERSGCSWYTGSHTCFSMRETAPSRSPLPVASPLKQLESPILDRPPGGLRPRPPKVCADAIPELLLSRAQTSLCPRLNACQCGDGHHHIHGADRRLVGTARAHPARPGVGNLPIERRVTGVALQLRSFLFPCLHRRLHDHLSRRHRAGIPLFAGN